MMSKRALCQLAKALEGLPVLGCLEGRPAARAGIRYGDVLLSVNGRRTKNFVDYLEARDLCPVGMDVVVFRDGVECELSLPFDDADSSPDTAALLAELAAKRLGPTLLNFPKPEVS